MPMAEAPNKKMTQSMEYVMLTRDRQGSRYVQKKLTEGTANERTVIFNSLFPHLNELVYDPSGNFVIQKMCEYLTVDQQQSFMNFILKHKQEIIDHPNGCRVLQKFIEFTSQDNVDKLFVEYKPNLIKLCFSQNGNHIVQRFISVLPKRLNEIISGIENELLNLVVDNCGCRVVQKLFEQFPIEKLEALVKRVMEHPVELATNQYGNYVVQNILEAGQKRHLSALINSFSGHFYEFSIHKFASNVIEKCIRGASEDERYKIFAEIIGDENNYETDRILGMITDQFGNYVIQRIIEYGSEEQQNAIYEVVFDNYDSLNGNFAKHVITKLGKLGFEF